MAIGKTPEFSRNVANRVLREHGLEGKVTPEQLADAAKVHDSKNEGYISGDEFKLAAQDLAKAMGGAADPGQAPVTQGSHSAISIRSATIRPQADLSDKKLAFAKERILANVGPGGRFGEVDAGEGLQAFTVDAGTMKQLVDASKLAQIDGQAAFGVLTTGERPQLALAGSDGKQAVILARLDLMDPKVKIPGAGDNLQNAAALFGQSPSIDLGGTKSWDLKSWKSGDAFTTRKSVADQRVADRNAARKARRDASDAAMKGPTTVAAFQQAGVVGHKHTDAEKRALLDLVKKGAGEDATFPNPDDSYYGLHVYLMEGPEAAHAVAFAQANLAGPFDFDPDKHSVLFTAKSFDEAQIGTFVVDRDKGEVVYADESNVPDLEYDPVEAFFPKADMDDDFGGHVVGTLAGRGEHLGVVAGDQEPDDMDFSDWA